MQDPRLTKRIMISLIYIIIFSIIGILFYYFFAPKATCTDGIQNQGEKGIDCGGPCSICTDIVQAQDLVVLEKAVVFGGNDSYDVAVQLQNPNNSFGASEFSYELVLKDLIGNVLAKQNGSSFILPAEKKYIAALGIKTEGNKAPTLVDITITNPKWETLSAVEKPSLNVYSKRYEPLPVGVGSEVQALLRNESPYDLNKVNIVVILKDEKGKIVAISATEKNTVRSRDERDFKLTWPFMLSGVIKNVEIEAYSNVFDLQNFIKAR